MRKRISPEARRAGLQRLERRRNEQQKEDENCQRVAATLMRMPQVCQIRRCRRWKRCLGDPPTCVDLHWDFAMQRWPKARARMLRELGPEGAPGSWRRR